MQTNEAPKTNWLSGNDFVAKQMEEFVREFKSSKPRPRASKMGLKPEPRKKVNLDL